MRFLESMLDSPDAEERGAALGAALSGQVRLPPERVDKLLRDTSPDMRKGIGAYRYLNDIQLKSLIGTRDRQALEGLLIRHSADPLPPWAISAMVGAGVVDIDRRLADAKAVKLSSADVATLAARGDPLTGLLLALGYGVGSVQEQQARLLGTGAADEINAAVFRMPVVPEAFVDAVLARGPPESRSFLLGRGRFTPTPQQVALVLRDADPQVLKGLLSRKDVDLPASLVNASALAAGDESLAFSWRQRKEFSPDATQTEQGLSSDRVMLRRSFIDSQAVKLTAEQVDRGLNDTDETVRSLLLHRTDLELSDLQLDRCMQWNSFTTRYACVRRPEFRLTQARFETLLPYPNPNILRALLEPNRGPNREAPPDLSPFIWATLRNGSIPAREALARQSVLPLDNAQISFGLQADEPSVVAAFNDAWRRFASKR